VVGILITRRRPDNAIGWVSLGIGFVWGLETFLFGTAVYGLANPGAVPMPEVFAAIGISLWVPGTFPSGHLARREGLAGRLGRMAVWALPVLMATAPFTETLVDFEMSAATSNPVTP
jgi:hypothetical protein